MFKRIRNISETILSRGWTTLSAYDFEFERRNGEWISQRREVYKRSPAVAVVPYDPARGSVLLTRQLRFPAYVSGDTPLLIEACAGLVDDGESPEEAVLREAEEELGYRLHQLTKLGEAFSSPGSSTEKVHLFLARYSAGDHTGAGGGLFSEGEDIDVLEMPLDYALTLVDQGGIIDLKTLYLLHLCKERFA